MISKKGRLVFAFCTLTIILLSVYLQVKQTAYINYFPGGRGSSSGYGTINCYVAYFLAAVVLAIWIWAEIEHFKTKKNIKF